MVMSIITQKFLRLLNHQRCARHTCRILMASAKPLLSAPVQPHDSTPFNIIKPLLPLHLKSQPGAQSRSQLPKPKGPRHPSPSHQSLSQSTSFALPHPKTRKHYNKPTSATTAFPLSNPQRCLMIIRRLPKRSAGRLPAPTRHRTPCYDQVRTGGGFGGGGVAGIISCGEDEWGFDGVSPRRGGVDLGAGRWIVGRGGSWA